MQQSHMREMTVYADIGEVRMEVRADACNQLLSEGWALLGVYPLTAVGEMQPQPQDANYFNLHAVFVFLAS